MYNKIMKEKFINIYKKESIIKVVTNFFNSIEKLERRKQKDIYYISYDDISNFILKETRVTTYRTYYNYISYVKEYKDWCMVHNAFTGEPTIAFKDISYKELRKRYADFIKGKIIRSFSELHKYIDDVFPINIGCDYMTKNEFFKMYLLLLYSGFPENRLFEIKLENIKIMTNGVFIEYNQKMTKIRDDELEELLKKRCNIQKYGLYRGDTLVYVDLTPLIINFGRNDTTYIKGQIKREMSRRLKEYNESIKSVDKKIYINSFQLYVSGIINIIKEDEIANNYKVKISELFDIFADYDTPVKTRDKKKLVKDTYNLW